MRYGLAFYELDGPLFALESGRRHMSLYVAEQDVVIKHKEALPGVNTTRSFVKFSDLNRLPLDVVEKIVRDSVAARRTRAQQGALPTQAELLKLWAIKEEAVQVPAVPAKPAGKAAKAPEAEAEPAPEKPARAARSPAEAPGKSAKSAEAPAVKATVKGAVKIAAKAVAAKAVATKTATGRAKAEAAGR
jgi:hypothetical protein